MSQACPQCRCYLPIVKFEKYGGGRELTVYRCEPCKLRVSVEIDVSSDELADSSTTGAPQK